MNILMVADVSISRVIGGAERALFEYSTRLAARGHNVYLLTRRLPFHAGDYEEVHGVHEYRFPFSESNIALSLHSSYAKSRDVFNLLCKQVPFDVINFHQPFTALGVIGSKYSKNIRKVYTCHSLAFEEFISRNDSGRNLASRAVYGVNWRLKKVLEKSVLIKSDTIAVLSEFTKEKLIKGHKISPEKILIIPGGVDLERFHPAGDRSETRNKIGISNDKPVLFTVRNLVARMGLENLLDAVGRVVETVPELQLVIGGRGILREKLEEKAKRLGLAEQVHFAGFIKEEELPLYYRMADFFVLPTKELEGFGLVTVEALASGIPVLGTPVGGTKEILTGLDKDLMFADLSPGAIAQTIIKWLDKIKSPDEQQRLSRQCREFAEKNYSWDDKIDHFEEVFLGGCRT